MHTNVAHFINKPFFKIQEWFWPKFKMYLCRFLTFAIGFHIYKSFEKKKLGKWFEIYVLPSTIQFGLHVPRTSTRFFVRFLLSMKLLPNWVILPKGSFVFYLVFKESKLCVRTSQDFSWQIFHGANNFENYETVGSQQNRNCIYY